MENLLREFAGEYALSLDKQMSDGSNRRTAYNPVIFLFLGDGIIDAVSVIKDCFDKKWDNSSGVLYFYIGSKSAEEKSNTFCFQMDLPQTDNESLRKSIYDEFYNNRKQLMALNQKIRHIRQRILKYGRMYSNFEKVNISVVTKADDPVNVLLPEVTLMLKTRLMEDFKMVGIDLYGLINEGTDSENFGYSSAAAMAFFREIEYYQDSGFSFSAPLEVLKDDVVINVSCCNTPLFDIVYLLSDKNEDGIIPQNAEKRNYEIIAHVNLLKNRSSDEELYEYENEIYNSNQFRSSIAVNNGRCSYASAGLSKINRPNSVIALTVLHYYYNAVLGRLKRNAEYEGQKVIKLLGMDVQSIEQKSCSLFPGGYIVNDMASMVSKDISLTQLDNMTYREAEEKLYGNSCSEFFYENYERTAWERLQKLDLYNEVKSMLEKNIINNPDYGLYCAYSWTLEDAVPDELRKAERDVHKEIDKLKNEMDTVYSKKIYISLLQRISPSKNSILRDIKKDIVKDIYGCKEKLVSFNIMLKIIKTYYEIMLRIHDEMKANLEMLERLKADIENYARRGIAEADRYLGQNINEYYSHVVDNIIGDLENKWGRNFFYDERFLGNITDERNDAEGFIRKLIASCKKYILSAPYFKETFEDELLHRANVSFEYGKENVMSQDELFKDLYGRLEKNARASIYIADFTAGQCYEEKYFFGDYFGEFLQYAFNVDRNIRTYKLGCVHERRTNGIEKLNLMGGFTIDDLVYTKNCSKYYTTFLDRGYKLHGIDIEKLPVI